MKPKFSDTDVVHLLANLKNMENDYPAKMMRLRRNRYIRQAAAVTVVSKSVGNKTASKVKSAVGKGIRQSKRPPR